MKALVFGGGGARGAYQIGAWRALDELGESFDIVTGTSIGAINAAFYVQGDYQLAEHIWSTIKIDDLIRADGDILEKLVNNHIAGDDIKKVIDFFKKTINQSGLDTSPMKAMLKEYIDEDRVRASKMKMGIVTISLTDLKPLELSIDDIPRGELHDYLIASSNLPFFQTARHKGKVMIDGGIFDNVPVELAKRMGSTSFTVIDLHSFAIGNLRSERIKDKRVIASSIDIGGVMEVDPQKSIKKMELGYYDTLRSYRNLYGRRYYIEAKETAQDIVNRMISANGDAVVALQAIFDETDSDPLRFILEDLIPTLRKKLDLPAAADYVEIYVALLEKVADSLQLDNFKVWQLSDFEAEIEARYQPGNTLREGVSPIRRLFELINPLNGSKDLQLYNTIYEKIMR